MIKLSVLFTIFILSTPFDRDLIKDLQLNFMCDLAAMELVKLNIKKQCYSPFY